MKPFVYSLFILLFTFTTLAADPTKPGVPFLTPPQAIDKMTFPDGFEVTAYAAEPDLVQPFAFTFDDRGRIWVLENLNYVSRGSDSFSEGPKGRIVILEDTDRDGQADKRKVFADNLFFPTGLALGFGGAWVGSPPHLLFIPDRDGDDVPDGDPQPVLDGWGRHDRHETLNSFTWGPDGWLYGCHGVFTHSRVGKPGTPDDQRKPINAGVWRYHPVKEEFEVFAWGTSNPWGLDFDNHGQMFITACVIPHLWHIIQGGHYHRQAGEHFNPHVYDDIKTIADHRHMSAHGGARFYLADAFPEPYRGRLFMCNIHEHAVLTDVLERKGSGFVGRHGDSFLNSNDPQWLGFNMEIGPDGAVYVLDWHDADICGREVVHGETGRIWRIAYRDAKVVPDFDLAKLTDTELIEYQARHPNDWFVRQARRLLHERAEAGTLGPQTHQEIRNWLSHHPESPRRLRALWALHVTGGTDDSLLTDLLDHEDEYLRAWTIQFLAEDNAVSPELLEQWVRMAKDDSSPLVRLYLASAMQRLPVPQRWDVLAHLAAREEDRDDHNLPLMVWYALEPAVPTDIGRALQIAKTAKLPRLATYITRRIAEETQTSKASGGEAVRLTKVVKVAPAESVSREGLVLHFKADSVVSDQTEAVSRWTDRLRNGRHALQPNPDARPLAIDSFAGRAALRFDGDNDHLIVADQEALRFSDADSFTMSAWVNFEPNQRGWRGIVSKSRDEQPWYGMWVDPSGKWTFGASNSNLAGSQAQGGWHHVCLVQDPDKGRFLYLDGSLLATGEARNGNGTGDLWIGGAKSTQEFFRGGLSELRLYNRPLSHSEIVHLAENP